MFFIDCRAQVHMLVVPVILHSSPKDARLNTEHWSAVNLQSP